MNHIDKLKIPCFLKWVSLDLSVRKLRSAGTVFGVTGSCNIVQDVRFYRTKKSAASESGGGLMTDSEIAALKEAENFLLEYLHSTRNLQFTVAEHISRNSPRFLQKLIKNVKKDTKVGGSIPRYLRYHPINEFEPFFESMGLSPSEYSPFLPPNLMFLSDDEKLLENYCVLYTYGIARNNIGKMYKEAREIFKYNYGVLQSKLRAFEEIGLNQSAVAMFVLSSPELLIGDKNKNFLKVLEKFKSIGIQHNWIEGHLLEGKSYNWIHMLELLCLLSSMGYNEVQLGKLICQHPGLLFETSGNTTFSLIGFLLKFGFSKNEIHSMFLEFRQVRIRKFANNLRQCYHFLVEAEMEPQEIGRIVCAYPILLGSCSLKKLSSLLRVLNTGKKRLCDIIKENPQILKDWVLGSRVEPLPDLGEEPGSQMLKTKFLLELGFVKDSIEMKKALDVFRGKGGELQERFDCFVEAGLAGKDVTEMIRKSPHILNQSKDVIKMKIDFLVNGLGYPLSSLVAFPSYIAYTIQRVKLRFSMYNWLKDEGIMEPNLALSTILASSENMFMMHYVNRHPKGPKVWLKFKKEIYPD